MIRGSAPSPLLTLLGQTPTLPEFRRTPPTCFKRKRRLLVETCFKLFARNYLLLLTIVVAVLVLPQHFITIPTFSYSILFELVQGPRPRTATLTRGMMAL